MNYFNSKDFEQLLDGLDSVQQVKTLRSVADEFASRASETEPDAVALLKQLYPDYAPNGRYEGKQFVHQGLTVQFQITRDYNFANHSDEYAQIEEEIAALKERTKARQKVLTALRKQILVEHPRLRPINEKIALKFITKLA